VILNVPINQVSFGQVSIGLLRELYSRNNSIGIFPIGQQVDFSSNEPEKEFVDWISNSIKNTLSSYSRKDKGFKLWHLNGGHESVVDNPNLFSFYELDEPTKDEINIVKNNNKVFFSSNYTIDIFKNNGCDNVYYIPLAFDSYSFKEIKKNYFNDGRITFNLCGKLEKRKHHEKVIKSWIKKYGNNPKYSLQCAIYNPFLDEKINSQIIGSFLEGKKYYNVNFLGFMQTNSMYNDFLNSGDIVIGMSGGEGWGLPEFHSVALGKHSVILNAHAYKDWANKENSILIEPSKKISSEDGIFFRKGINFNQGNIFDFEEDDFINGCEEAIKRVEKDKLNKEGLKLQEEFTFSKTLDSILKHI